MTNDLRSVAPSASALVTYQESMADIIEVLQGLEPTQWNLPTPCPGWSIADIAAHLIDLDMMAMGAATIDHEPDWDSLPHVKSPASQFTERGVDFRRGTPPDDLLDQLKSVAQELSGYVANNSITVRVPWSKGEISPEQFLAMRAFDVWVHEQDIRNSIDQPGNLGSNAALAAAQRMFASIPLIWGKKVQAPAGSSLTLTVTGPDVSGSLHVVVGSDGRATIVESLDSPDNSVTLSWPDFADAFTGRVPVEVTMSQATIQGDLAETFISSLASTP